MKKIFTLLTFLTATNIFATDRFVDPNLSAGNGTTLFTSITSAVNAAVNGDRIIIASTTYNEPALTISKSLQIMPQTPGTIINFNANIIISGFAGMKLEITGFNLGIYSFSSNSITSGSYSNRAKITIIECLATNVDFNNDFYDTNIINNNFDGILVFKYGNIISNNINSVLLFDENLDSQSTTDKILITNNNISYILGIYNNNYRFVVANNLLKNISVKRWNSETSIVNKIINNEFLDGAVFQMSWGSVPYYNIVFSSNKFNGSCSFNSHPTNYAGNIGNYGWYDTTVDYRQNFFCGAVWPNYDITAQTSSQSLYFPEPNVSGFFEWSYNGLNINCPVPSAGQPLALTRIIGPINDINGGNPNHNYYDIDLTINDRGINGGPYSQLNYNPTSNLNNSKAFIFDLDMPTDLFPGQSIDIKAKGYHKN